MSKAKPCPKVIGYDGATGIHCGRPKKKGKQACEWHWLLRQSSDIQAEAARLRLAAYDHTGGHQDRRMRVSPLEWPYGERWCAGCQSFVPLFYVTGSRCKACVSMSAHAARVERVYGIDDVEYDRLMRLQGRRCAICRNQTRTIRLAVDHDHKTGEVRGLLCKRCNHELLGAGHDSVTMLWRAITYLLFPPAQIHQAEPPLPGTIVAALRAHLEQERAEARKTLPEPEEPPF